MHLQAQSVDDLLRKVFTELLKTKSRVKPTKGENGEIFGILLELKDPRARLSRAETRGIVFSCIGEFLWYMAGRDDLSFIKYYIKKYEDYVEADGTINGAYGPRIFDKDRIDQLSYVIERLKSKPDSRRAVIQLYDARDTLKPYKDVPCTCTLQFVVRNDQVHMQAHMRSNDAYIGLPHDIFCFTMLQEVVAVTLGLKLGIYKHAVGSLHLYTEHNDAAQAFIDEGFQDNRPMPPMPASPHDQIQLLLKIEDQIRMKSGTPDLTPLNEYWADLARLLQVKAAGKSATTINKIRAEMKSDVYETYVRKRHKAAAPQQSTVPGPLFADTNSTKGKP